MKDKKINPPKLPLWILRILSDDSYNSSAVGDCEEMYKDTYSQHGKRRAFLWIWRQVVRSTPVFLSNSVIWSCIMFKNYLKITLRNLKRHKGYFFINISGLIVGIVVCILIFLYVKDELSYDKFNKKADRIYRIVNSGNIRGNHIEVPLVSGPWGPAMVDEFPEVLKAVRLKVPESRWTIKYEDKKFFEKGFYFADPSFLEVFDIEIVSGDPENVLDAPYSIVITEEMAKKYFADENPIGKVISADLWLNLNVTGIMKKHPSTSHMNFNFLANFETLLTAKEPPGKLPYSDLSRWENFQIHTYILLDENANPEAVEGKMSAFLKKHLKRMAGIAGVEFNPYLQKLTDIHLKSHLEGEIGPNSNESYIYIFSIVAVFILIIASINFMNLSTARSVNRAKEVGMRKVIGATRLQLTRQFLIESVLLTFFAVVVAGVFVLLLLPEFNTITGKDIKPSEIINIKMFFALGCLSIIVGLISGSYPAFLLSAFRPIAVLSGKLRSRNSGSLLRRFLVVVQFVISIFLIIALSVIYSQMNFLKNKRLGFDKEHIIAVPLSDYYVRTTYESYKNSLLANSSIKSVSGASGIPGGIFNLGLLWTAGSNFREAKKVQMLSVDYDFIETFDIELLKGRGFLKEFQGDMRRALLLNEEAVQLFGFDSPIDKILFPFRSRVTGVVKNYHFKSLHQKIEPFVLQLNTSDNLRWVFIKIKGENIPGSLSFAEKEWQKVNPDHPFEYTFVDENYDLLYQSEMKLSRLFSFFTGIALFIACLGLFGLSSFTAEQRTKEIGIRKVLGASVRNIVYILMNKFMGLVILANFIAWPVAYFAMGKWLRNFAYKADLSLYLFALSGLLALVIAAATISYQTIKAARANPVNSLKYE